MSDDELLALMVKVDPMTRRIPEGIRAIAQAIEAAERERWKYKMRAHRDMTVMSTFATYRECEAARNAIQRLMDDGA